MRKLFAIVALAAVIGSSAYAVDMGGKIGFGVGPVPQLTSILQPCYFSMRVGVINPLVVEPWFLYYSNAKDVVIDPVPSSDTTKTTVSNLGLGVRTLFAILAKEKSNLYATFGFGFNMPKVIVDDYSDGPSKHTTTTSEMYYIVFLGLELEHFLTNNFSIAISTEGGFSGGSSKEETKAGTTTTTGEDNSSMEILLGNGNGILSNFGLMFNLYL